MSLTTRFTLVEPSDRVASLAIGKLPSDLATLAETIVEKVRTDIPPSSSDITPRLSVKPSIMIGRRPCRSWRRRGLSLFRYRDEGMSLDSLYGRLD